MTADTGAANLRSAEALVAGLAGAGLRNAVVCPGSRSTPLAVALLRHPSVRVWMHVDERSAGFFGLGMARATGRPVALLCSSGTAAANFLPAMVEAYLSRVPLVALTADRPVEVRGWGAAQTIDQDDLYGSHVKLYLELPIPEDRADLLRHAGQAGARAAAVALAEPRGPVHLNAPFREPLLPASLGEFPVPAPVADIAPARAGTAPDAAAVARLAGAIAGTERGIIVCGPDDDPEMAAAAVALGEAAGYPVIADPLSGARCGGHPRGLVIDAADAFLRDPATAERLRPDLVIRAGAMPTSKPVFQFMQACGAATHAVLDRLPGWRDPFFLATEMIDGTPAVTLRNLTASLPAGAAAPGGWASEWQETQRIARAAVSAAALADPEFFEGRVYAELAGLLPDGATLVAGNSMPVRDLDTFFPGGERSIRLIANRGANGIDGVISTALGFAAAPGMGPVLLAIGDLSFYHDMNGLLAARLHGLDLTIVVTNNDGGGIFSFLPQASQTDRETFETLFGTPTGLDLGAAAALYGGTFTRARDWDEFRRAVSAGVGGRGLHVVEVVTDRERNVAQHRAVWKAVAGRLAAAGVA
ncbi:MAG: 2-succinyl-5-enolpyruvyl-6-hydroxy-3-cyclohexene-1-carboxylic-acid synthase [Chloroflexota bacterium]